MIYYNLVNHRKKFIVSVNPKCGCNSIRDWFNYTLEEPRENIFVNATDFLVPSESFNEYDDYFKFLVLRDPRRRLVSFYYAWVVLYPPLWCFADEEKEFSLENYTFQEFLVLLLELFSQNIQLQHHLFPQTADLSDVEFDEVIKLEELNEKISAINHRLAIDYPLRSLNTLAHSNTFREEAYHLKPSHLRNEPVYDYASFYNQQLDEIVSEIYREDLTLYENL